jgi:hypothetical protein
MAGLMEHILEGAEIILYLRLKIPHYIEGNGRSLFDGDKIDSKSTLFQTL